MEPEERLPFSLRNERYAHWNGLEAFRREQHLTVSNPEGTTRYLLAWRSSGQIPKGMVKLRCETVFGAFSLSLEKCIEKLAAGVAPGGRKLTDRHPGRSVPTTAAGTQG